MKFAHHIRDYLEYLIKNSDIGLCAGNIAIDDKRTGSSTFSKTADIDRFKLAIPYGGQFIQWEVIFNEHHPEFPPDFIFDPSFRPNIAEIESLKHWHSEDPASLLNVIKQLLHQFRRREIQLLEAHSRLHFEYTSLLHLTPEEDVEVAINHKSRNGQVTFLIRLPVDFSAIPPYLTADNPGMDSALLMVLFHNPEATGITPRLVLSPRVENALGGNSILRIPQFAPGECLIDYVPKICNMIKTKLKTVVESFEKRKEFVSAFLSHFGRGVVEYDAESFFYIVLLIEWRDFYFILHISLNHMFPSSKPIFTFQSVYHTNKQGDPYHHTYSDYPFSPRWSGNEMAERTRSFLKEYIPIFQWMSIESK